MQLYVLTDNYNNLLELMENEEVDKEVLQESLNQVQEDINEKVENTSLVIKSIDADIKTLDEEIKRLTARKKALERNVSNLKGYLLDNMNLSGVTKVKGKLITTSIRKTECVNITNENAVPNGFKKIEYKISKTDIKKALKNGESVQGAELKINESINMR